jgi:hypothetical protein
MRKRGSSRKKLRMPIASKNSKPSTRTIATAAAMRPLRVVGTSPRRTGTRQRARRKPSSPGSSSALPAGSAGLRVRPGVIGCGAFARAVEGAAGRKNSSTGSSSANTVTRLVCESIFATPESGREICLPNYNADSSGHFQGFAGVSVWEMGWTSEYTFIQWFLISGLTRLPAKLKTIRLVSWLGMWQSMQLLVAG